MMNRYYNYIDAASAVAQHNQGRVQDLGRGSCSKNMLQSPEDSHTRGSMNVAAIACSSEKTKLSVVASGAACNSKQLTDAMGKQTEELSKADKRRLRRQRAKARMLANKNSSLSQPSHSFSMGSKRAAPEVTPSSISVVEKKQRQESLQSVFSDIAVKGIKLAITHQSFPYGKLQKDQEGLIVNEILKKIDLIPSGNRLPKISNPHFYYGVLNVVCEDSFTAEWVKEVLNGDRQILGGEALKVLKASELPKPVKVAFKTKDVWTKEPEVLLKRLKRLNPLLKSEEWRTLQSDFEPTSARWIFEVDWESADAIRRTGFVAYTGIDKGTFKIIQPSGMKASQSDGGKEGSLRDDETSSKVTQFAQEIRTTYSGGYQAPADPPIWETPPAFWGFQYREVFRNPQESKFLSDYPKP